MSRRPRSDLPGFAQHIVQRGNNRGACFFEAADYRSYLAFLSEAAQRHGCAVHAYVLMSNHVHLLVTPGGFGAVSRMMQTLGRNYVGAVNARYRRTGTLWEGRYKACLVDDDGYMLSCYRYIESNPVRAAMVTEARDYPWSSHLANAFGVHDPVLTPHACYVLLGGANAPRRAAYRALLDDAVDEVRMAEIRAYLQQGKALGSVRFQAKIEAALGRCMTIRPAHRPAASAGISRRKKCL